MSYSQVNAEQLLLQRQRLIYALGRTSRTGASRISLLRNSSLTLTVMGRCNCCCGNVFISRP